MTTFTKSDLVRSAAHTTGLLQCDTEKTVDALLAMITKALSMGGRVEFRGFGVWEVRLGRSRVGRIPCKPGSGPIKIPSRPTLRFKPSRNLKTAVRSVPVSEAIPVTKSRT